MVPPVVAYYTLMIRLLSALSLLDQRDATAREFRSGGAR
jgi:hypothetical protein